MQGVVLTVDGHVGQQVLIFPYLSFSLCSALHSLVNKCSYWLDHLVKGVRRSPNNPYVRLQGKNHKLPISTTSLLHDVLKLIKGAMLF